MSLPAVQTELRLKCPTVAFNLHIYLFLLVIHVICLSGVICGGHCANTLLENTRNGPPNDPTAPDPPVHSDCTSRRKWQERFASKCVYMTVALRSPDSHAVLLTVASRSWLLREEMLPWEGGKGDKNRETKHRTDDDDAVMCTWSRVYKDGACALTASRHRPTLLSSQLSCGWWWWWWKQKTVVHLSVRSDDSAKKTKMSSLLRRHGPDQSFHSFLSSPYVSSEPWHALATIK